MGARLPLRMYVRRRWVRVVSFDWQLAGVHVPDTMGLQMHAWSRGVVVEGVK